MSATDELHKLLDERGVEWTARPDGVTEWVHDGMTCKAVDRTTVGIEHLTMLVPVLTPEQAIAATLGERSNTEQNGVTADQVMAIAGRHQPDYCSDTHVCFDWQAIADELNATLGAGTCRNLACHKGCTEFVCSECGAHYLGFRFSFCPHCGARIEVEG